MLSIKRHVIIKHYNLIKRLMN